MASEKVSLKNYYATASKLKVVQFAEDTNKSQASKRFKVHSKRVQVWCKQKEELKKSTKPTKALPGRGHKVANPDIENRLLEWMKTENHGVELLVEI